MIIKGNKYLDFDNEVRFNWKYIFKICLNTIHQVYYKIIYAFIKPRNQTEENYKYNVSICAFFKDEADYLKEWIEFHRIVGVDHFYLYNNKSNDNYLDILNKYIRDEIVTLVQWPEPQSQMKAYQNFFDKYKDETKWVGFIDLDEFVIPNSTNDIYSFLKPFEKNRSSVVINWKMMGSSGFIHRDIKNLLTEDFTCSWEKYLDIGKYFFNTRYEYYPDYKYSGKMHFTWAKVKGIPVPPVNVFDKVYSFNINPIRNVKLPIQINHYLVKSYDEYIQKKSKRGGGVHPLGMHDMNYFYEHEMKCQSVDFHAYKYLILLKLRLMENTK
jgi:hypothetical protein